MKVKLFRMLFNLSWIYIILLFFFENMSRKEPNSYDLSGVRPNQNWIFLEISSSKDIHILSSSAWRNWILGWNISRLLSFQICTKEFSYLYSLKYTKSCVIFIRIVSNHRGYYSIANLSSKKSDRSRWCFYNSL